MSIEYVEYKYRRWIKLNFTIVSLAVISGYALTAITADSTLFMQSAAINGASDTATFTRVPVRDANGKISYKNIALRFDVDSAGNVSLNPGSINITPSPVLDVGAFKQGTYNGYPGYNNQGNVFDVGTPGVSKGGRTSGSIQRRTTMNEDAFNANWMSGPIKGHPDEAALRAAHITSTGLNWGVMGTAGRYTELSGWKAGDIIGAIQTGNQLTLQNFGNGNIPLSALTFTLCPTADPC